MTPTWRCITGAVIGLSLGFGIGYLMRDMRPTFDQRFYFHATNKGDRLHFNIYGAGPPHCFVLLCRVV
jgi:hypothetical protein